MKTFLNLLVVILFVSSDAFPQNFIKRNEGSRFVDKAAQMDFIMNESTLSVNKFDSIRFCAAVTLIYESLNLEIFTEGSDVFCLMGFSEKKPFEYNVSFTKVDNIMVLLIMNSCEMFRVYSKDEFKRIRKFQVELAEMILNEVRRYL